MDMSKEGSPFTFRKTADGDGQTVYDLAAASGLPEENIAAIYDLHFAAEETSEIDRPAPRSFIAYTEGIPVGFMTIAHGIVLGNRVSTTIEEMATLPAYTNSITVLILPDLSVEAS
jgi:hypothetical protein